MMIAHIWEGELISSFSLKNSLISILYTLAAYVRIDKHQHSAYNSDDLLLPQQ